MKKLLKIMFAVMLMLSIIGNTTTAATVNLTTSDTSKASSAISAKGAKFSGSNSAKSAHSVRFYSQYKNSAGSYVSDADVKVLAGASCPETKTYKFASNMNWRLLLKPNAWDAKDCTASGVINSNN